MKLKMKTKETNKPTENGKRKTEGAKEKDVAACAYITTHFSSSIFVNGAYHI